MNENELSRCPFKGSCVSEQGQAGLLWTVFEGEPFCSDRIASFSNEDSAREYMKLKGHPDFTTAVETDDEILKLHTSLTAPKSTEAVKEALKEIEYWHADMLTADSRNHPRGSGWARVYDKLKLLLPYEHVAECKDAVSSPVSRGLAASNKIDAGLNPAMLNLSSKSTKAEGDKERLDWLNDHWIEFVYGHPYKQAHLREAVDAAISNEKGE